MAFARPCLLLCHEYWVWSRSCPAGVGLIARRRLVYRLAQVLVRKTSKAGSPSRSLT
jgi:hypothetical protein